MENIENTGPQPEAVGEAPANPEAGRGFIARTQERLTTVLKEFAALPLIHKVGITALSTNGVLSSLMTAEYFDSLGTVGKLVGTGYTALNIAGAWFYQREARKEVRSYQPRRGLEGGGN